MKPVLLAAVLGLIAAPALASEPWGSDYHMGFFIAYGGDDQMGRISLECGDPASEREWAGDLSVRIVPSTGLAADGIESVVLATETAEPITLAVEADGDALMSSGEIDRDTRLALLAMMDGGGTLMLEADTAPLAEIPLEGATAALEGFEACTQ